METSTQPKPLERQIREARARRPTIREAVRAGVSFGVAVGVLSVLFEVIDRTIPRLQPPLGRPPGLGEVVIRLALSAVAGGVVMVAGASLLRLGRRVWLVLRG